MRSMHITAVRLAAGASLAARIFLAASAATAGPPPKYTAQAVVKRGDKIGASTSKDQAGFEVDALSDNGQLLFVAYRSDSETLWQYANGTFTPIVIPNTKAPTANGRWPHGDIFSPTSMNQNGDAVFTMWNGDSGGSTGVFQWNAAAQTTTAVALPNQPAVNDLTFTNGYVVRPAINNKGEIAFPAEVRNAARKVLGTGIFFRGLDGSIRPVALPGSAGPDGVPLDFISYPSINDAGRVSFLAQRYGQARASAFLWDGSQITPIALVGQDVPGGKIVQVSQSWVNNRNGDVLVEVILNHLDRGPEALYRWSNGQLTPAAAPGMAMPGGGAFSSLQYDLSVSFPNEAGQHAFNCFFADGNVTRTGAFLLDADGTLSPIVKSGEVNELGTIARVGDPAEDQDGGGFGIAVNGKGQVALILKPVGAPQALSLLTPASQ